VNLERLQQIEELYTEAVARPSSERAVFLDSACGNDTELRAELDSLLETERETASYLDKSAIHFVAESLARQGAGLLVGRILGRYQLLSLVGRGGAGDVYCAVDSRLNRLVAVKILVPYLANDVTWSQRFEQEARLIAGLNHPHICVLHDAGHDRGVYYLVFEYLVGEVLSDRLSREALPLPEVLEYAIQIAEALEHAHQQGIVHHDLKPQNIMLVKTGVKLVDFGIAELRIPEGGASAVPAKDSVVGTLAYMAPEQIQGRETDARTDIFAFGVTLSEMLAARVDMPSDLDDLLRRCLADQPSERWQSISDVLVKLRASAKGA
jgi:serine/threonine protein kinase